MTAIVLAGGGRDDVAALDPGAPNKAFVRIGGHALVTRTIDALRNVPRIVRIIAVAPDSTRSHPDLRGAHEWRPSGARVADSLRAGLEGLDRNEPVLIAASDLPILSRAAAEEFIAGVERSGADIAYACVERSVHQASFPDVPHTWAHLRDGDYCGGGLIAMRPRAFEALERFLDRLGAARKRPLRLASLFGYDMLIRYALRRLSVADAERRASQLLGFRVRAVVCAHPEIAINVDRKDDVARAERLVARAVNASA
jgi:GTP:adenosylcobinamide-phosphate guanylyltransferase